jgi:hypothetical protein
MAEREWHPPGLIGQFFRLALYGFPRQILWPAVRRCSISRMCRSSASWDGAGGAGLEEQLVGALETLVERGRSTCQLATFGL